MIELYWGCLIVGILAAAVSLLAGDLMDGALEGVLSSIEALHPLPFMSGVTVFGATGLILSQYLGMDPTTAALPAVGLAIGVSVLLHFVVVKPMQRAESSLGYSIKELQGKMGEVSVPIPAKGYGEVMVRVGSLPTFQIAGSFDGEEVPDGTSVVVVEIRDGALYVSPFSPDEPLDAPYDTSSPPRLTD
jgi:membrane protein implicated in regulation of membrane protease activity